MKHLATNLLLLTILSTILAYTATGQQRVDLNGVTVHVVIPVQMKDVHLIPNSLETRKEMSILRYELSVKGTQKVCGLHWRLLLSDKNNQVIRQESWWDRGDWMPESYSKAKAVFQFNGGTEMKLTLLLMEVESVAGITRINRNLIDGEPGTIIGIDRDLESSFTPHIHVSQNDRKTLLGRSLQVIMASEDLKERISLDGKKDLNVLDDEIDTIQGIRVRKIDLKEVRESIRKGNALEYFEYCCFRVSGASIEVILNYHKPKVSGNSYFDTGIRIEVGFAKLDDRLVFSGMRTSHF